MVFYGGRFVVVVAALAWRWNRGELAWVAEEELAAVAGELSLLALGAIFITSASAQIVPSFVL